MGDIILKYADKLKIPGVVIAIFYFAWSQKFISIIRASDVERLFFSHEKRLVYRAFNWIILFLITFTLMAIMSFAIWFCIPKYKFISSKIARTIANVLFVGIFLASVVLKIIRRRERITAFFGWINAKEQRLSVVFYFYYIIIVLSSAHIITIGVHNMNKSNKELMAVVNVGVASLLLMFFLKSLLWMYKERTVFSFIDNGDVWYIIKLVRDNEFIVGDKYEEEECKKIKFVSCEEVKQHEIIIEKIKDTK